MYVNSYMCLLMQSVIMEVDGIFIGEAQFQGSSFQLNVHTPLQLGGVHESTDQVLDDFSWNPQPMGGRNFRGCIRNLTWNNEVLTICSVSLSFYGYRCGNSSLCLITAAGYE